jgi:hypothetical protein
MLALKKNVAFKSSVSSNFINVSSLSIFHSTHLGKINKLFSRLILRIPLKAKHSLAFFNHLIMVSIFCLVSELFMLEILNLQACEFNQTCFIDLINPNSDRIVTI